MSVDNLSTKVVNFADGLTQEFSFPFKIYDETQIEVIYLPEPTEVDPYPEAEELILNSDYTVTFDTEAESGSIETNIIYDTGKIVIKRIQDIDQLESIGSQEKFKLSDLEFALDKLTLLVQNMKTEIDRTAQSAEDFQYKVILPEPVANFFLAWHPTRRGQVVNREFLIDLSNYYNKQEIDDLQVAQSEELEVYADQAALDATAEANEYSDALNDKELNFILDGSFEKDETLALWKSTAGDAVPTLLPTTLETSKNKRMLQVVNDPSSVIEHEFTIASDMGTQVLEGWIKTLNNLNIEIQAGSIIEDLDILPDAYWQKFSIPISPDGTIATIRISIAGGGTYLLDSFYFGPPSSGVSDHGSLNGLADDDHTQYHNDTRGDARYNTKSEITTFLSGKANSSHTHPLSQVTQSGAIDGQVPVWDSGTSQWVPETPPSGVTDHGALSGLADDDHTQYHNDTRGDARYYTKSQVDAAPKAKTSDVVNFENVDMGNMLSTLNPFNHNQSSGYTYSNRLTMFASQLAPQLILPRYEGGNFGGIITQASFLQNAMWERRFQYHQVGPSGTTPQVTGINTNTFTFSPAGVVIAPSYSGSRLSMVNRLRALQGSASTTAVASYRQSFNEVHRPYQNGDGGFFIVHDFGISNGSASNATRRMFFGLSSLTTAPTDVNPSTTVTDAIGVGCDSGDTNLQFILRQGSSTATKIDLGTDFPKAQVDNTSWWRLIMACSSNHFYGYVQLYLVDLVNGYVATYTETSNLPNPNQPLNFRGYASVGGTSSVVGVAFMKHYCEYGD